MKLKKYYAVWTSTKGQIVHDSTYMDFPGGSDSKVSAYNAGDPGLIPGLGRSSGEGNGKPLQYSCLENPMKGEHGRLQSMGSQRVGHDWATLLTYLYSLEGTWFVEQIRTHNKAAECLWKEPDCFRKMSTQRLRVSKPQSISHVFLELIQLCFTKAAKGPLCDA